MEPLSPVSFPKVRPRSGNLGSWEELTVKLEAYHSLTLLRVHLNHHILSATGSIVRRCTHRDVHAKHLGQRVDMTFKSDHLSTADVRNRTKLPRGLTCVLNDLPRTRNASYAVQ